MSTKTSIKRIALVAVSALGFGLFSVVPARAADAAIEFGDGSALLHRTDAASASTFTIQANGAQNLADTKQLDLSFTRNSVAITGVPSGITINWDDTQTSTAGNAGTEAGNVLSADMDVANFADNAAIAVITVGTTMAPGVYTVKMTPEDTLTASNALTFYVTTAPSTLSLDKSSYAMDATAATPNAVLTIKDAQGNPTYLVPGEALDVTVTGGVTGATKPTVAAGFLDAATAPNTATTRTIDLATNTATTGTYTLTVARAAGMTGLVSATASIVVGATPQEASGLKISDVTTINSNKTTGGADADFDAADDNAVAAAGTAGVVYISTSQNAVTYRATTAATSGTLRFTIAANGTGLAAGLTAGSTDVAIVADGLGAGYADYTVTSTAPAAGYGFSLTVEAGANDFAWNATYQAPVPTYITTVDPLLVDGSYSALQASSNSFEVEVYDQFDNLMSGVAVTFAASGRNTASSQVITNSSGAATFTWTDTSTATLTAAPTTNLTATIATPGAVDGYVEDSNVGLAINYKSSLAVSTVTTSGNIPSKSLTANSIAYASAISSTSEAQLKTNTTALLANNGANVGAIDQAIVRAVVKDSLGNAVVGVRVTFTGTNGVFFKAAESASLTSNASIVAVAGSSAKTTFDAYTDANGYAFAQARFTKTGTATVTATSGGVSATALSIKVVNAAADARSISTAAVSGLTNENAVVSYTVLDGFGNPVSGVDISFTITGTGTLLSGTNTATGKTDASGVASVAITSNSAGTSTVTGTVTTSSQASSEAAAVTALGFATGVKSASSTVTITASTTKSAEVLASEAAEAEAALATAKAGEALTAATTAGTKADAAKDEAALATAAATKAGTDAVAAAKAAETAAVAAADAAKAEAALSTAAAKANAVEIAALKALIATLTELVKAGNASADAATDAALEGIDAGTAATDSANIAAENADAATAAAEEARDAADAAIAAAEAATAAAEEARDIAQEALDAANAAVDAAALAAEAADAATVAAEEAREAAEAATAAIEELATQMSTLFASMKAQLTTIGNTIAKISKKVKA